MYVIRWKSTVNGRAGKGTKLFTRADGQQLVEELNHEYPQIQHELVEADRHGVVHAPSGSGSEVFASESMELAETR